MNEEDVVKRTRGMPATVDSLVADLCSLGIAPGMVLLVHSSLSSLGWVSGGPVAVILALEQVLGPRGTLVMPALSGDLSDPARWKEPPVPQDWWGKIRESMPAFDPEVTPTREVGVVPECFRNQKGVLRSSHPQDSFSARGPKAEAITKAHGLDFGFGEKSPLARLYEHDAWVLMLGTDFLCNSSLHLCEYRASYPGKRVIKCGSPIFTGGKREWVEYDDLELSNADFGSMGEAFIKETGLAHRGHVAIAEAILVPQRALVDFGVKWIEKNRQ
jgi:aminoglycoside 3-N-acetyltransferase